MNKKGGARNKKIKAIDEILSAGGFRRARNPNGALVRARATRDKAESTGKRARSKQDAGVHGELEILRPAHWDWPWLVAGFSTRRGGESTVFGGHDLNLGLSEHDPQAVVEKNRRKLLQALGAAGEELVGMKQIHSDLIHVLRGHNLRGRARQALTGDGAVTNAAGLLLSVQTADCVPVLIVDAKKKAVGVFHAGWRGTAKRIVEKGVGMMRMAFRSDPEDMHAAIGPSIGACCYAVGSEVVDEFQSQFAYADKLFSEVFDDDPVKKKYPMLFLTARPPGHSNLGPQAHLDLVEANRRQLIDAGIGAERIWASGLCTKCTMERLFSHRGEGGFTGRMMGLAGIRKQGP